MIKELAGRVRLLEELVHSQPELKAAYQSQTGYRAAFEEDEYNRLVRTLQDVLEALPDLEGED